MSILSHAIIAAQSTPRLPPKRVVATVNLDPDRKELAFLRAENEVLRARVKKLEENLKADFSFGPVPGWDFDPLFIREIIAEVAKFYGVRPSDIFGASRARKFVRPRQIAMYFARELTLHALSRIGRAFGNRDHTTVLLALRRVPELRAADEGMNRDILHLEYILRSKSNAKESAPDQVSA
jgi:hypothetical protein